MANESKVEKRRYYGGGRKPTGQLIWRKTGWFARFWSTIDDERVRVCRALGTTNKAVARLKLARLLESEDPTPVEATRPETFEEAARRIVSQQKSEGLASWKDRNRRLEVFAFPEIGTVPVPLVRPSHVRAALERAVAAGMSHRSVLHLKVDISTILGDLWHDELVSENAAKRCRVPKGATKDTRERVILTDEEFSRFMACPGVDPELHTMALTSRTFGGMRTSDLHAWDWEQVDTVDWRDAHVPRPKTKTRDRLTLPAVLLPVLRAWWDAHGQPRQGPVFPSRRGKRAGQRKEGKHSYAKALREVLWDAGVVRPLPGFSEAFEVYQRARADLARDRSKEALAWAKAAEQKARSLCLIQAGSAELRPLDFHSFRRAFNTGLAAAGVNVQMAMRLAGHRNAATHMRYVQLTEALEAPPLALPSLKQTAPALPIARKLLSSKPGESLARPVRFERTTFGSVDRRSIQLSYGRRGGVL